MHDRRMIEICEKLAFPEKALAPRRTIVAGAKQLDSDLLLDFSVATVRQVHCAHSTGAEPARQAIGATLTEIRDFDEVKDFRSGTGHTVGRRVFIATIETQ